MDLSGRRVLITGGGAGMGLVMAAKMSSWDIKVSWEDRQVSGAMIVLAVGNGRQAGGGYELNPHARLDDGLLDQPIQHGGNAEDAFAPPFWFGNRHALHRAGPVAAIPQLASDHHPVGFEPWPQLTDGHAVNPRATVVGLHSSQGHPHVVSFDHCIQQSVFLATGVFPLRPSA